MLGQSSFTWTSLSENIKVGNYSAIAAGCFFHTNDNHYCKFNKKFVSSFNFYLDKRPSIKDTVIGNDVWIGRNANILEGITIGDGAIIGTGAVVTKDVPPYAVVVGNPGKVIKYRFPKETIEKLLKIKWWNWKDEVVKERLPDFEDVDKFVEKYL